MEYNFIIDCSDNRNIYLLKELSKDFYVKELGAEDLSRSGRYVYIFAPSTVIDEDTALNIPDNSAVFCLKYSQSVKSIFESKNITAHKLFDDEVLAVKNAYLTAEGTLSVIIENTAVSLKEINALILGFGRVGKGMALILNNNGCVPDIVTDDPTEYALAHLWGDKVYYIKDLNDKLGLYTVIVNTIPCVILKGELLKDISKDCLIIDLASNPGGIDFNMAKELNLKVMHLLGVPGKYAPKSSGKNIKNSIFKILNIL